MGTPSQARWDELIATLRADPTLASRLVGDEASMVRQALAGDSVYEIAQQHQVSEEVVWNRLHNAARLVVGWPAATAPVETGGLGSDTDPGVTGGYGDTGFGAIGNEPPYPTPEEPEPDEALPEEDEHREAP